MGDNKNTANSRFSVDDILAEARNLKQNKKQKIPAQDMLKTDSGRNAAPSSPEKIAEMAKNALNERTMQLPDLSNKDLTDINSTENNNGRKKRGFSFFKRHTKEFSEIEEDIYYGLQLKSIDDYRQDYNNIASPEDEVFDLNTPDFKGNGTEKLSENQKPEIQKSNFSYLFNENSEVDDEDIAKHFEQLHKSRKNRVENIMRQAGIEYDEETGEDTHLSKKETVNSYKSINESKPTEPVEPTEPTRTHPPTEPTPSAEPQSKPEIQPNPVSEPEIKQPITEPVSQPSAPPLTPPSPLQPDTAPLIQCESSQSAVKDPVITPQVKEELPLKPQIREPEKPVPRSLKAVNYNPINSKPLHVILLDNLDKMLNWAQQSYPPLDNVKKMDIPAVTLKPPDEEEIIDGNTKENSTSSHENITESTPEPILISETEDNDEEYSEPKPKKRKRFHIFGMEEEENDLSDNLPGEEDELDDYLRPGDSPSISNSLSSNIRKLYLKVSVTAICMTFLIALSITMEFIKFLPQEIQTALNAKTYLILNIIFLVIAGAFCATAILNGIKGMLKLNANSDSGVAIAVIAVLIQNIVLMFSIDNVEKGNLHLYSVLAVIALFFNSAGKLHMIKRIDKNFRFVAAPDQKQSVQIFEDHNTALQMAKGCVMETPVIAYQSKTNFLKHFLRLSYASDASDRSAQTNAPVGFIMSLILCIVSLILWKDISQAITVFAAASCICIPVFNIFSVNKLINNVCNIAYRCGAMVVGYPSIEHFCDVNAIVIDAKDLFPRGTVVLNYIKAFAGQRIDEAIMDATALINATGGPLSDMFDQIIKSGNDILPKIEKTIYEEGKGVSGWVGGKRIFVGNRELLKAHGIEPPSHDYEDKYLRGGKKIVYLASGGDLVAMFVVTYNSDRNRAMELRRMENNGISLILHTCDPNITPELISECFGLDVNSVRILPEHLENIYNSEIKEPKEYSPAYMAIKGRPTALMRLLTACVRQSSNISVAIGLQNIACIIGFLLIAVFTLYAGFSQLSTNALLIYELFWALVISFVPKLRKP